MDPFPRPLQPWRRASALLLLLALPILFAARAAPAAELVKPLPGSAAQAKIPPLQVNQAPPGGVSPLGASGPTTPILDDFNRGDEDPLSQSGNWAPNDPRGLCCQDTLEVISNQAAVDNSLNNISYRQQDMVGDFELYATIPVKAFHVSLVLNIVDIGPTWDGYYLTWDDLAGPDILRFEKIENNTFAGNIVVTELELAAGDKFMVKRLGTQMQGWVYQSGSWSLQLVATEASFNGGKIGALIGTTAPRLDDFRGGAINPQVPPVTQSGGTCDGSGVNALTGSECMADPVNALTGAFTTAVEDLYLPGTGVCFAWGRTYTSNDSTNGRLGLGWTDRYAVSLIVTHNGDVVLHGDEGQQVYYTLQGDGSFVGAPGSLSTLSSVAGGYKLVRQDQVVYLFDMQGRLLSEKDRNDQGLTFSYDGQGRLQTITDAVGRQVTISYNASNLVSQVQTQDGRSVSYGYTGALLTSVTDVRGKLWTYTYDHDRLQTIVDPLTHTKATIAYGVDGRVSTVTDAVQKTTTFAWDPQTQVATMTDANGKAWKHGYSAGVLVTKTDPLNKTTLFGRDDDLNTISVRGPTGETTTRTFDGAGNMLQARAPASLGSVTKTFVYNARNDPTQVTDARGKITSYTYFPAGNLQTVTQDGTQMAAYTYDASGRVLTFTDGNSKTTTYTYFANGNLESRTNPLGEKTTYTYDGAGRVLTRVDPRGNCSGCVPANFTWTYTYNPAGQVLTETDPLGNVTTHTYDDAGRRLTVADANGKTRTFAYDNANRLLSDTAPDTGVTSYAYDNVGNTLTETDPLNHTTTYTYDPANRVASVATPTGAKTTSFYDANGNLSKTVEPRGNVQGANPDDYDTLFTYDAAGRLLTTTDPLGNVTTRTYDAVGNELTLKDANNKTTTKTYDGKNRLATVTAPDTGVATYTYDAGGNRLTEKDPRNNTTTYTYDGANRRASVTKPSGGKTTFSYDENGNLKEQVEPRGNVQGADPNLYKTTFAYDRVNRRTSMSDPLGNQTLWTYDNVGNTLSVRDANLRSTAYTYDAVNRLKTVTAPDLGVTTYIYDVAGNVLSRKDARNNTTTYAFDLDNRRTTVTSPIGQVWTTEYDPADNVLSRTDANGNATPTPGDGKTTYTYDFAGKLTAIDYSDTTPDVSLTYDGVGNRLQMTDGSGQETRTYDPVNRLLSVTRGSDTFSYLYDLAGNVTRRTYPGNVVTDYTYDVDNRLATAVGGGTTTYGYDVAGNLTSTTLPSANGYVDTRVYDRAGRPTEVLNKKGATTLSKFVATLDPVGNPLQVVRTGGLAQTQVYTYDANDRILSVCFQAGTCPGAQHPFIRWTYDLVGNRLTEQRPGASTTNYSYNNADQLLTAGSTAFSYDQNGNQTQKGSTTFTYDLANRLKTHVSGSTTTTYTYDGDGKRLQASTGALATNFLWDPRFGIAQLALERDGNNALIRRYSYGIRRISQTAGSNTSYYLYDVLGSAANLTSSSGATEWTWSYEPFGSMRTETPNGTPPANLMRFTGEYLDPTGLYHLRARQYDSAIGRFLRPDPLEPTHTSPYSSAYAYADDRPMVFTDPTGMRPEPCSDSQALADSASSPVTDPAGNNCTRVPDAIGVKVWNLVNAKLIDFSFSCIAHDDCYGRWLTERRVCDDDFHARMKVQCDEKYGGGWWSLTRPLDWAGLGPKELCNKVADLYYYGVQQLGGVAWDDKAYRYAPPEPASEFGGLGCPYSRGNPGTGACPKQPDVPRCLAEVLDRSYEPLYPTSSSVTRSLRRQILEALIPFYG